MTTSQYGLTYRAALLVRQRQDTAANVASILLGHSLEEVDQVTLVVGSQLGNHAHIEQYQMRGRWDVEDICHTAPRGVGVHQPHQYVSLQTTRKRFDIHTTGLRSEERDTTPYLSGNGNAGNLWKHKNLQAPSQTGGPVGGRYMCMAPRETLFPTLHAASS